MSSVKEPSHEIYIPRENEFLFKRGIGEVLFDDMKKWSDKAAQINAVTGEKESHADLHSRSIRTAQTMQRNGIKPEDVVSLLCYNNMDFSCVTLASFFTGVLNAPMDPTSALIDIIHCLKLTTPKILFCDEELETTAEEAIKTAGITTEIVVFGETDRNVPFSDYLVEREPEDAFQIHQVTDVKSTACLHFSSGTTGLPKAVCVTHYGLLFARETFPENAMQPKITLNVTFPCWISNTTGMVTGFLCGDARVIMKMFDVKLVMEYTQDYQINFLMITPPNGADIIDHAEYFQDYDFSSLIAIGTGGSITSPHQFNEYKKLFPYSSPIGGYGMTEAAGLLLAPFWVTDEDVQNNKNMCIGTPIAGFKYKIVDPETEEVLGPNNEGELRIKCETVMNGYYKNPEAYKNSFDSEGYFKTGDIMYYEEGYKFYFVARIKDNFKYQGFHVPVVVIENELMKHPNVKQAVVFGVPEVHFGELATAAIVLKDPETRNEQEFMDLIAGRFPIRYHLHGGVYIVDKIPMTSTGKIQRRNLMKMVQNMKNED